MAADGTVTGTGTKWQSSLSLIRPGATIMFLSSPIQMAVVNKVVSDTEIKAITTNGAVVASTDYAILLSDSLTVDGLAQDVAETLRYYQSQETTLAEVLEFFENYDFDSLKVIADQVKADSEAAGASASAANSSAVSAAAYKDAAKTSETNAKASEVAAENARDHTQQIIDSAGDQSTLVVLAQPTGALKSGLLQGGTIQDALTRVNVLSFGADPTGLRDSSKAVRAARDYAVSKGILELYFPAGTYTCADYIEDVYLPADDGTVYPSWVGVNGDVNIAAETQYKAKTFCRLPRGMRVTGDGKHATRIRGNWDNASSTIPTTIADVPASAGYGFFWTNADNKSAANGHSILGVTLAQYYVARGGDGIMVESFEDDLNIEDCAFSGIFQGAERCHSAWLEEKRVYAPTVVGGHWLQRNNTQTISMLPPYPATDAWTLGWCDAWTYATHHHTQYQGAWGSRHEAIDIFFDNMYYKSRNTPTYANGGRLSNNSNNPASIPPWIGAGVAGRARVLLSRYGRQINSNGVNFFKAMGEHRTPYYCATSGGNNVVHDCFLEAIGLVDNRLAAGGGNYFGITIPDPLNPTQTGIGYMVGVGGIQLANYTPSARLQHAPLVSALNRLYGSQQYVNFVPNNTDRYEMERRSLWDGSNTVIKYLKYSDYQYSQPIAFSLGGEKLNYSVLSFTPGITIGGVANSSLTGTGYLVKTGRQLVIRCRFTASGALDLPTGAVKITGLPYSIPNNIYGISFGFAYCPQLVNSISVFPRVGDVATEINLIKDSKGTALDGDDFSTTQTIFLWVEMTATILE